MRICVWIIINLVSIVETLHVFLVVQLYCCFFNCMVVFLQLISTIFLQPNVCGARFNYDLYLAGYIANTLQHQREHTLRNHDVGVASKTKHFRSLFDELSAVSLITVGMWKQWATIRKGI